MSEITPRSVAPSVIGRAGRTRLSYPDLELPRLTHGIVVFKNLALGLDYPRWLDLAPTELRSSLAPAPAHVALPRQVHSSRVIDVDRERARALVGDGVVTARPLVALGISVSDCIPLFGVDLETGVAGLAHCGWRGIAGGVVEEFLRVLESRSADPEHTAFLIGAGIGPCCYEVGNDLLEHFNRNEVSKYSQSTGRGVFFDLKSVVASRLVAGGASPGKISIDNTCTSCQKYLLSSYRADGRDCGRMLAFLMLTE